VIGLPRYSPIFRSFRLFCLLLPSTQKKSGEELKPFGFHSFPLSSKSGRLDLNQRPLDPQSNRCSVGSVALCDAYHFGILSFPRYSPISGAKSPFSGHIDDSLRTDQESPPPLAVPALPMRIETW